MSVADPRPTVRLRDGVWEVAGWACAGCGYRLTSQKPRCPACQGVLAPQSFGPDARVWAGTVLRVPIHDRTPPIAFAWVDFEGGPRLLCHVSVEPGSEPEALLPGTSVVLAGVSPEGDPLVRRVR